MKIKQYIFLPFFVLMAFFAFETYALGSKVDHVIIEKSARKMYLMSGSKKLKSYSIALGYNSVGPKQKQGDGKTPEGQYIISGRNANSSYHKALVISYPNFEDRTNALKNGVSAGSNIVIHGFPNLVPNFLFQYIHRFNWTLGAIAVTDDEIDEIWNMVQDGTPITIKP